MITVGNGDALRMSFLLPDSRRSLRPSVRRTEDAIYLGLDDAPHPRIVYWKSQNTMDDTLAVRHSLLEQYPAITMYSALQDMHAYVFQRSVLDVLVRKREAITSVREELVPFLIKCQTSRELFARESMEDIVHTSAFRLSESTMSGDPKGGH